MVDGMYHGIFTLLSAQNLNGTIGNNFIGIHIEGGACSALNGIYNECIVKSPRCNLITGLHNGAGNSFVQKTNLTVGNGRSLLNICHTVNNFRMHVKTCNVKIFRCPQRLNPIIYVTWYVLDTDGILLCPVG